MSQSTPKVAYLFDVDGVLTNPETKRVEYEEIFTLLLRRLELGLPIGLNTGRSLDFVREKILDPLAERMSSVRLLELVYAVGEKGATWITHNERGDQMEKIDSSISVPATIQDAARELLRRPEYAMMFFDDTKKSMVSLELLPPEQRPGVTLEDFQRAQKSLVDDLRNIIRAAGMEGSLRVDPTRIATDIENVRVGKALGARKFLELLQARGINPRRYVAFGDSPSDYEMHEELMCRVKDATFVFVGGYDLISHKPQRGVHHTSSLVDRGTLEFLQSEQL